MKKYLFLAFFIIFKSNAQYTVDLKLLEKKLIDEINNHRVSLNLKSLEQENTLTLAAEDHNFFLLANKTLTHFQPIKEKKTPFDRVKYYGGKIWMRVGENILSRSLNKNYKENELSFLAKDLFLQWKNSPGHYKNMIDKNYTHQGLRIIFDSKINKIYATQVFGKIGKSIPNQLSDNAFGVKEKETDCEGLSFDVKKKLGNGIDIDSTEVFLYYHDLEIFKSIFKNENDGIALDFVEKKQFACETENDFDVSPIYDGIMAKPFYRDQLLNNNTAENALKLITKIGDIPPFLVGKEYEINLIIIINGCACEYAVPIEIESKTLELFDLKPKIKVPEAKKLKNHGIILSDTHEFDFERNQKAQSNKEFLKKYDTIHSYQIYSYSSVEGNELQNNKLHNERANYIKKFVDDAYKIKSKENNIIAKENWEKCKLQLAMENMEDLINKPKNEIRKYINDNKVKWEDYLKEQRKSYIVINYFGKLNPNDYEKEEYGKYFLELNLRTAIFEKDFEKANFILSQFKPTDNVWIMFEDMIFNEINSNPLLTQNAAAVLIKSYNGDYFKTFTFLNSWLSKSATINEDTLYNLLILYCKINKDLLSQWDVSTKKLTNINKPNSMEKEFLKFESNKELQANYSYVSLYYYNHINDYKKINECFSNVYYGFKDAIKTNKDRLNLALFLNHWSSYDYSIKLLIEKINTPTFSKPEALLLAQTVAAYNNIENEKTFLNILNKVYKLSPKEWCDWQNKHFNVLRDNIIKNEFCLKCKN